MNNPSRLFGLNAQTSTPAVSRVSALRDVAESNPEASQSPPDSAQYLEGSALESFLAEHESLSGIAQGVFADLYRNFSDDGDLFVLCDRSGRLITLHGSSELLRSAASGLGLRTGALLDEEKHGGRAISTCLQHGVPMLSTSADRGGAPLRLDMTVAVPLLDAAEQTVGCVAILNHGAAPLGEKLLLAKIIVRELARTVDAASESNWAGGDRRKASTPCWTIPGCRDRGPTIGIPGWNRLERRRGEDRRRARQPTATATGSTVIKLTRRQQQVLRLFAQGKGYKEIARDIGITSYKTVEEHLDAVREKLKVEHRRECIHKAMSLGLL